MPVNIIINTQAEGIHNWPDCFIPEVSFLKHPHRHIFFIVAKKEVTHNDRDIEIIQLKRKIDQYLIDSYAIKGQKTLHFGSKSCEMIAEELFEKFQLSYCSVLEDNENGAEIFK